MRDIILEFISRTAPRHCIVRDVAIGVRYAYAVVECGSSRGFGVAYVPLEDVLFMNPAPDVTGMNALDAISSLEFELNMLHRVLAVAVMNAVSQALFNPPRNACDILEVCEVRESDTVVVVGNMKPVVEALTRVSRNISVIERSLWLRMGTYPDTVARRLLQNADVVLITGATLSNGTFEEIVEYAKNAREVAVVGPTAQTLPEIFARYGVTAIASLKVTDTEKAATAVKLGGGSRTIARYGYKYAMHISPKPGA